MGKTVKVLLSAAGVMGASALLLLAGAALLLSKAGLMPWDLLPLLILGGELGAVDGDPDVVVHRDGAGGGQGGRAQTNGERGNQYAAEETFSEPSFHV